MFALAFLPLACQPQTDSDVTVIESSLLPRVQIEGVEVTAATIEERMAHFNVPGVSVAVYRNGELAWAKGYGYADVESETPVTTTTLFQAASISKPIAAMAALDMAEDGLVDIDENINMYLTSWALSENAVTEEEKVTIRRLLNHTAGTTVWGFPGYKRDAEIPDAVGVVSGQGNTDSIYVYKTPGESWQYSGGGTTVMQIALSDVAGMPFEQIMEERVISPLQMGASTYEQPLPENLHDLAATAYSFDGSPVEGKWHVYPEQAAAGLWTTPTDIGKYAVDIQNTLAGQSGVLELETVEEMLTPGLESQGLGPAIIEDGTLFSHGGSNEGFRCYFLASKDGEFVVAIMTNSANGGELYGEILQAIFAHYEWPGFEPTLKPTIDLSEEDMAAFTGSYNVDQVGLISIVVRDGNLYVDAGGPVDEAFLLLAEDESTLFDPEDGQTFTFSANGAGEFVSFEVEGLTGRRVQN